MTRRRDPYRRQILGVRKDPPATEIIHCNGAGTTGLGCDAHIEAPSPWLARETARSQGWYIPPTVWRTRSQCRACWPRSEP